MNVPAQTPDPAVPARTLPLALAALLLSSAVYITNGLYSRLAIGLLLAALAVFAHAALVRGRLPAAVLHVFLVFAISLQAGLVLATQPLNDVHFRSLFSAWPYYLGWSLAGVSSAAFAFVPRRSLAWLLTIALAGVLTAGSWAIYTNQTPRVDVFYYQQDAALGLLHGENPYTQTFPNPYESEENWVFAPGSISEDGSRILFGYPYLPVTLLGVLPGLTFGDYRYAHLLFVVLTAILVASTVRSRTAYLAIGLLLTHPRMPWILEWGWTEPLLVFLLAATLCASYRKSRWTFLPLGLLFAAKQYMPLLLPIAPLALPANQPRGSQLVCAALVALIVTIPFVLWEPGAFWHSAIALQFAQPFRPDALSFPSMAFDLWGARLPIWLPIAAAVGVSLICLGKMKRTSVGFAWAVAIGLPVIFVLSKQAFANYYFFCSAGWCLTLAFDGEDRPKSSDIQQVN